MSEIAPHPTTSACPFHFDLRDPHTRANAFAIYAEMRQHDPATRGVLTFSDQDDQDFSRLASDDVVMGTSYDVATEILVDERFSIDGRTLMPPDMVAQLPPVPEEWLPLMRNLLSLDPPDHTRLRRLVQPSFSPKAMEVKRPRIQAIADELIDAMVREAAERGEESPSRRVDLVDAFAFPLPMNVISEMLGVPPEDRNQVRIWSEPFVEAEGQSGFVNVEINAFSHYLRGLFEIKRRQPADDLISEFVHAQEAGEFMDDVDLLAMVFILIVAGHITTVNLIGNMVIAMENFPAQRAKLIARPELTANAVEETLRYWGPVEMSGVRFAKEDLPIGDVLMQRGQAAFPFQAAANRDPARFPDPDRFDIERPEASRHIAFGKGVHLCLGAPLARVEAQIAISTLLRRLPHLRLREPMAEPPLHQNSFRGPHQLDVLF